MRRKGRKRRIRSNKSIRYCSTCQGQYISQINDKIEKHFIEKVEEQKAAKCKDQPKKTLKRLSRKNTEDSEEFEVEDKLDKKKKAYNWMWKQVNKKFVVNLCKDKRSKIYGNPCHNFVTMEPDRYHKAGSVYGMKGKKKHSGIIKCFYEGCNANEIISMYDNIGPKWNNLIDIC